MKITFVHKPTYAEEGQPNPLRWCLLSGTPEKGFTNESSWLRCKDFFNDYVVAYNGGKRFGIYGFSTEAMNIPHKGMPVYIALDSLSKSFEHNLSRFNYWLNQVHTPALPIIQIIKATNIVLEFNPFYFKNTYNISLVSLIVRLLNAENEFSSFEEVIKHKGFATKDQQKWDAVVNANRFFKIPEALEKYVWYCGPDNNSEKQNSAAYSYASLVHNNGVLSWTNYMKGM